MTDSDSVSRRGAVKPRSDARPSWGHWTALALFVVGLFAAVHFRSFAFPTSPAVGGEGRRLAQLHLQPLTAAGPDVSLDDLEGRVVLLHFWGTWSVPCRTELSYIAEIERRFRGQAAFRALAVSCSEDAREDLAVLDYDTRVFLRQANVDMPTYADAGGATRRAVAEAVGLEHLPATLVLDRQGAIRGFWSGARSGDERQIRQLVGQLLAEGP